MRIPQIGRSPRWTKGVVYAALGLQLLHLLSLLVLAKPAFVSNLLQFILPVLVGVGCLFNRAASRRASDRRAWALLSTAFGFWTIAEASYLIESHYLSLGDLRPGTILSSVDDVLWLLFAVPLLLVVSGSLEGKLNLVSWLDQIQAFVFFVVVVVLVYSHPSVLSFNAAYSVQNLALLLSCSLRYSAAETHRERKFFLRLGVYLAFYSLCASMGNALAHRGWPPGSVVDLFWTAPLSLFCLIVLTRQTGSGFEPRKTRPVVEDDLMRYLHDLSALGLAALSMGSSVYLSLHSILPGSVCLLCSFAFFAVRTCVRERELHRVNTRLHESVRMDALTGLGNRVGLREYLGRSLDSAPPRTGDHAVAVLFVDLDRFKAINDGLGHDIGDKVIMAAARRITVACEGRGRAFRLGGDEFVVVLIGEMAKLAEQVARTTLAEIHAPLWVGSNVVQISGSIGVAIGKGEADDLLRNADHAMYRAKRLGKNRVEVSNAPLVSPQRTGFLLEAELRECLHHEQIIAYLQPIFSLQNNDVFGFEALARWNHPQRGIISPREFIPLAEETGMIIRLGRQILTQACREVARWNAAWNTRLSLSVNISARQFSDPDLLASILEILACAGMDPELLHLEITESVLLVAEDTVAKVLMEAQQHGMDICLDDFGTGYSSLSHLLSFPTDEIKIDRSFVRRLHQDARRAEVVRTVLQLGRSLNKRVVAEGVETREELETLQEMGCRYVQGYLFGKPFPVQALADKHLQIATPILPARPSQRVV
jgi:diguanylate cyclase (GGDEF)-like protein